MSLNYTGKLGIKYMAQSRQPSHEHVDQHYCAALILMLKVFCVKHRQCVTLVDLDGKHACKVGEPNYPVAAVDRGGKVLVAENTVFVLGDHDFTKAELIQSVTLLVDIPESATASCYKRTVNVCPEEAALQPSSPLRQATELSKFLTTNPDVVLKPILAILVDVGPDHRIQYLKTQISIICLFLKHDLDYIATVQAAP